MEPCSNIIDSSVMRFSRACTIPTPQAADIDRAHAMEALDSPATFGSARSEYHVCRSELDSSLVHTTIWPT